MDALRAGKQSALIDVIGARRTNVDLLKHNEVGPHIVEHVLNSAEVFQNLLLVGGLHACAAVHEEVGVLTEPRIADVPAHYAQLPIGRDERAFFGRHNVELRYRIGAVLGYRKPREQQHDCRQQHGQHCQQNFPELLHMENLRVILLPSVDESAHA